MRPPGKVTVWRLPSRAGLFEPWLAAMLHTKIWAITTRSFDTHERAMRYADLLARSGVSDMHPDSPAIPAIVKACAAQAVEGPR